MLFLYFLQKSEHNKLYFGRDYHQHEVDFLIQKDYKIFDKIQVVNILNDNNMKREISNLMIANKYIQGKNILVYNKDFRTNPIEIPNVALISAIRILSE